MAAMRRTLVWLFTPLLCLFYGVTAAGQILGIARLYYLWLVIPVSVLLAAVAVFLCFHYGRDFYKHDAAPAETRRFRWLDLAFLIGGLGLFLLLVFYPLSNWPRSPITAELPWDAGLYHFPKAIEMIVTHSAWDLSISYGEYPFGYESLIALAFSINHPGFLIGVVHAFIALFFFLSMTLLIVRHGKVPFAPVVFLVSLVFLGYQLARNFDSNIWWIFWPQVSLIGKNDVLLAASLLAVLLMVPLSREGPFFPFELAIASAIALSIKPNAAFVVLFAWGVFFYALLRAKQFRRQTKQLIVSGIIILPGILWAFRNIIAQGAIFSQDGLIISGWSIASNLFNPFFYKYIPQHLYYILGIILVSIVVSIFRPSLRMPCLTALVLLAAFAITPASAFLGTTEEPAQIAWRFALALLAYILLLLLALFEPIIVRVYHWMAKRRFLSVPLGLAVLIFSCREIWLQRDLMSSYPENERVLNDQYPAPVGTGGYYSAYAYVQRNVHDSVVNIENGLPYYLFDPEFTNSVTRSRPADFVVYLQTPWLGEVTYPETLNQPQWLEAWQLVYEDSQGRVYQRR